VHQSDDRRVHPPTRRVPLHPTGGDRRERDPEILALDNETMTEPRPSPERFQMALQMAVENAHQAATPRGFAESLEAFHGELRRLSGDPSSSLTIDTERRTVTLVIYGDTYTEAL